MELKDFISETIKQITDGVLEGSSYVKLKSNSSEGIRDQYTKIDFDIAITTNEENKDDFYWPVFEPKSTYRKNTL